MNKKPKAKTDLRPEKLPKTAVDPERFYDRNPAWRIAKMEWADPYGWQELDGQQMREIYDKLCCFERMTWGEILVQGKKQNHLVPISDLSREARGRLEQIGQGDLDELLSLRLSGTERVWGILDEDIVTILWWDPHHEVCPSFLRNT